MKNGDDNVLGGALLSLDEAVRRVGYDADVLMNSSRRGCHPIPVGRRFYFFETDLQQLLRSLALENPGVSTMKNKTLTPIEHAVRDTIEELRRRSERQRTINDSIAMLASALPRLKALHDELARNVRITAVTKQVDRAALRRCESAKSCYIELSNLIAACRRRERMPPADPAAFIEKVLRKITEEK